MSEKKLRVLLVDDDDYVLEFFKRNLEYNDYIVDTALSVDIALEFLTHTSYDICLTDLNMPEKTGEDLVESIRKNPSLNKLPIAVLSSRITSQVKQRLCPPLDMEHFFDKTASVSLLAQKIKQILSPVHNPSI